MRLANLGYTLGLSAAVAMLFGCGGSQPPIGVVPTSGTADHFPNHKSFYYTGARQSFKVPTGVTRIDVVARGGAGEGITYSDSRSGRGGRVHAVVPVKSGETLYIFVGGAGFESGGGIDYGGFNGGGNPGRGVGFPLGGGGASDIRQGGAKLSDRILVAGGGGGMGGYESGGGAGGSGGGSKGGPGGSSGGNSGGGGGGGTQRRGGPGGSGAKGESYRGGPGEAGELGTGGHGGSGGYESSDSAGGAGGGGGGGYYGGGGGGGGRVAKAEFPGGGGGGGSSYIEPSAVTLHTWPGWRKATGNGLVVFSWQ